MTKPGALPLAVRIPSRRAMVKQYNAPKPFSPVGGRILILGSIRRSCEEFQFLGLGNCMRSFSSSILKKATEKPLPWLAASSERQRREVGKKETSKGVRSSWEESAEKFLKGGASAVEITGESRRNESRKKVSSYVEVEEEEEGKVEGIGKIETSKGVQSSWEESAEKSLKGGALAVEITGKSRRNEFRKKVSSYVEVEEEEEGEVEGISDPRWYNIRKRYDNFVGANLLHERAEVRRWNKQENWGRKTWKEAKESTVPKMIGEGVYGVGPVLAALAAARREFYALYVQEGLDLTNTNKKKDKKGFVKILKMAENIGLSKKEVSKHDLNMVADNRPHQGLVLDASPLEMVGIKELEPVSTEGPLWLALDEVTDPQNLGAIIRSAYFFGACGVVLCAKNSAPLSGVVSKASAGSLELMEVRSCKNMMQFLASSAGNGWRVLGGSVSARAVPLSEIKPGDPTILVLGSEGTGLRPLVERSCTELIRIPGNLPVDFLVNGDEDMDNPGQDFRSFLAVESLNVSVAAGVLLHHLTGNNKLV